MAIGIIVAPKQNKKNNKQFIQGDSFVNPRDIADEIEVTSITIELDE